MNSTLHQIQFPFNHYVLIFNQYQNSAFIELSEKGQTLNWSKWKGQEDLKQLGPSDFKQN